jgi:hypothetical protein
LPGTHTQRLLAGAVAVCAALAVAGCGGGGSSTTTNEPGPVETGPKLTGSIVRVDKTWTCTRRVDLASVTVTMTPAAGATRKHADAIHLRPGCTGRIGRVEVTQSAGDGIKIAEGVHDLEIDGGSVRCLAKAPGLHQDGVQVLGGERITFRNLRIDCGRAGERLINSNLFINQAGRSKHPPTDVVCDHCSFGGGAAHTVNIQNSVRSGITDSTFCPAKYAQLTLTVGALAEEPLTSGNLLGACAGHEVGQPVEPHLQGR